VQVTAVHRDDGVVELLWAGRPRGALSLRLPEDDGRVGGWWLSCDGGPAALVAAFDGSPEEIDAWSARTLMYAQTVAQGRLGKHVLAGLADRRSARARRRRQRS
jgi:hypothetical protein